MLTPIGTDQNEEKGLLYLAILFSIYELFIDKLSSDTKSPNLSTRETIKFTKTNVLNTIHIVDNIIASKICIFSFVDFLSMLSQNLNKSKFPSEDSNIRIIVLNYESQFKFQDKTK